jgi:hypothetical protein
MLALLISRAKEEGQITGLVPHLVEGGLSILQYVDDTIILMDHNIEQARNIKLLLCVFEQLSVLKINFHKSDFFVMEMQKNVRSNIMNSLAVVWDNIHSSIWGFLCTIRKLVMKIGR